MLVDESDEKVIEIQCQDCAASEGGCKHAIAFLMWVHRRSEEPEPTATVYYWKKPRLAKVSENIRNIKAKDMVKIKCPKDNLSNYDPDYFYNSLLMEFQSHQFDCQLSRHCIDLKVKNSLSLHEMLVTFYTSDNFTPDAGNFLKFSSNIMTLDLCNKIAVNTKNQSECNLWKELRYGRLTASRLHEMAHCGVSNGSLVNQVINNTKVMNTKSMRRGKNLEKKVIEVLQKRHKLSLDSCGLLLNPEFPAIAASPNAVGKDFVVEIKCPTTLKTERAYITSDMKLGNKCFAQIQLQMFLRKVQKGLFCMAKHNFESTHEIIIIWIDYDEIYVKNLIQKAMIFWESNIFPLILKTVQS